MVSGTTETTRPAAVAGSFYTANAERLSVELKEFTATANPSSISPKALIVPHAGHVYSGPVAGHAYRLLENLARSIRRVVILGPAHRLYFTGVAAVSSDAFETPLGRVAVDQDLVQQLVSDFDVITINDEAHAFEHCIEVQLPFLQQNLDDFSIVPLLAGNVSVEEVVEIIEALWPMDETLIMISTDLSHFHAYGDAKIIDGETIAAILDLDWKSLNGQRACGYIPLSAMLAVTKSHQARLTLLDARNSGDTAGDRSRVVGYASFVIEECQDLSAAEKDTLLQMARTAIEQQVVNDAHWVPPKTNPKSALSRPGAAFVTLTLNGALRGCIGSLEPKRTLAMDVCTNAVFAATRDPRFPPLSVAEMQRVELSVSVLTPSVPLDIDSEQQLLDRLTPGVDGLVIEYDGHRATFLPSVWDMFEEPSAFVRALKRKAGLREDFWHPHMRCSVYKTISFSETGPNSSEN